MNQAELTHQVSKKLNVNFNEAQEMIDAILNTITEELVRGEKIKLKNFGNFEVVERAARKGFNPHIREEFVIPACKEPVFKPGKELKEFIKSIDL